MAPLHRVGGRDEPAAVILLGTERVFLVRTLRLERREPLSAAGHGGFVRRDEQISAVRTDVKPQLSHISVVHIVFLHISAQQHLGADSERLRQPRQDGDVRRAAARFP